MNDSAQLDPTEQQIATAFARRAAVNALPPPDLAHLHQLARQAPAAAPARRNPFVVRGIAAAVVAAALAGGAVVVLHGGTTPGAPGSSTVALSGDASTLLRQIADVTATEKITPPRADQYVYTKIVGNGIVKGGGSKPTSSTSEVWAAQKAGADSLAIYGDGTRVPITSEVQSDPGSDVHLPIYAELAALPTDAASVRAYLLKQSPGDVFGGAELTLAGNLVPSDLASAIYKVLADEHGLTVVQDETDAAGRPGVGIGYTDRKDTYHELIFDKGGLHLIGMKVGGGKGSDPEATVVNTMAFVDQAVVDNAGQRP